MKKSLVSATLALGLAASGSSWAGGIQIDPTGTMGAGGNAFIIDPGNSFGNALAQGTFPLLAGPNPGTMYIQNAIDISGTTGIAGSKLTFVMDIPVLASLIPIPGAPGIVNFDTLGLSGTGTFSLYYEDPTNFGDAAANKALGTGFTDGPLLASGTVTLTTGASWLYTSAIPGTVPLATNSAVPTIQGAGSTGFDVDFTFLDPNYVLNNLTGLSVDLDVVNTLSTPFTGMGVASTSFAEAGAGAIVYGTDGMNDFTCGIAAACDMQYQANTTLNFRAEQVPEPGTLALTGLALGLAGLGRRLKKNV